MIGLGMAAVIERPSQYLPISRRKRGVATLFGMILALQPVVLSVVSAYLLFVLYDPICIPEVPCRAIVLPVSVLWIWNGIMDATAFFRLTGCLPGHFTHQKNISRLIKGKAMSPFLIYRDRRKIRRRHSDHYFMILRLNPYCMGALLYNIKSIIQP